MNIIIEQQTGFSSFIRQLGRQMGKKAQQIFLDILDHMTSKGSLTQYKKKINITIIFYKPQTAYNICSYKISTKEKAFVCYDCMIQSQAIFCNTCFQQGNHAGHNFQAVDSYEGYCDCGDQQSWNPKTFCKNHGNQSLVEQIKKQVDQDDQKNYIFRMKCYIIFWFFLYNQAQSNKKDLSQLEAQRDKFFLQRADQFGKAIFNYMTDFNCQNLIFNWMTYNLFTSKLEILKKYPLSFVQNSQKCEIFRIILKMTQLTDSQQQIKNTFISICRINQFRDKLTIAYSQEYKHTEFAESPFVVIGFQLFGRYKLVKELVISKQLKPIVYYPNTKINFQNFKIYYRRYKKIINYLCDLPEDSAMIYWTYYIENGCLAKLQSYKKYVSHTQEFQQKYFFEHQHIQTLAKVLKNIKKSQKYQKLLEKGIKDIFTQLFESHKKNIGQQVNSSKIYTKKKNSVFVPQQLSLSLLIFAYFDQLNQKKISQKGKIKRLLNLLGSERNNILINVISSIISLLCQKLYFSGLCLGHHQTAVRFQNYFKQIFNNDFVILSLQFYLLKILLIIKNQLDSIMEIRYSIENKQSLDFIAKHFKDINRITSQPLTSDNQKMFDRKKIVSQLSHFCNIILQATQSDSYQIFIANFLGLNKNYIEKIYQFCQQILQLCDKVPIKQFKKMITSLNFDYLIFQRILLQSNHIDLKNGRINIVSSLKQKQNLTRNTEQNIFRFMDIFYFKSFREKLNLKENSLQAVKLTSMNKFIHSERQNKYNNDHLLSTVIQKSFMIVFLFHIGKYIQKIPQLQTETKRAQQLNEIGQLIFQIIKIKWAFECQGQKDIQFQIKQFLQHIFNNCQVFPLFSVRIQKLISNETNQINQIKEIQNQPEKQRKQTNQIEKSSQRKKKLLELKKKKLNKHRQSQATFQQKYTVDNTQNEKTQQILEQNNESEKQFKQKNEICVICRQSQKYDKNKSNLMITCQLQLSDLYTYFLTGKHPQRKNYRFIFTSCGHYIHESCHIKLYQNKDIFECPLCRAKYNLLLPLSVHYYYNNQIFGSLVDLSLVQDQVNTVQSNILILWKQLTKRCQNGFKHSLTEPPLPIIYQIMQFIVCQIVLQTIWIDTNSFSSEKNIQLLNTLLLIFKIDINKKLSLKQRQEGIKGQNLQIKKYTDGHFTYIKLKKQQIYYKSTKQMRNIRFSVHYMQNFIFFSLYQFVYQSQYYSYKEVRQYLSDNCIEKLQNMVDKVTGKCQIKRFKKLSENQNALSEQLVKKQQKYIQNNVLQWKKTQAKIDSLQAQLIKTHVRFYKPPQDLKQLIKIRDKCKQCSTYTDSAMVCFVCQWQGCRKCSKQSFLKHAVKQHMGSVIFIELKSGQVHILSSHLYCIDESIYKNIFNEQLTQIPKDIQKSISYKLDQERVKQLENILLNYELGKKIKSLKNKG